jgi:lipid-A-disaccharide synthase
VPTQPELKIFVDFIGESTRSSCVSGGSRLRIALVAGEASGDTLGAALIERCAAVSPAEFAGVAGPKMKAAGCVAWHDIEELAVMGSPRVSRILPR